MLTILALPVVAFSALTKLPDAISDLDFAAMVIPCLALWACAGDALIVLQALKLKTNPYLNKFKPR